MQAFQITEKTYLSVSQVTPDKEIHGDERVQRVSLRLAWTTSSEALDQLHAGLRDMLFFDPPEVAAQLQLDGMPPVKKHLRCPIVKMPLAIKREHSGYTLTIDHGISDESALQLYDCTVGKFTVEAHEGGTVEIAWSVGSNKEITPELLGALCALKGDSISAVLISPKPGEVIEGTTEAFRRDHPGADDVRPEDLFSDRPGAQDQHAGDFGTAAGGDDDAGHGDGAGQDDAAAFEAGVAASLADAGLSPKAAPRGRRPAGGVH
jgi:hypothetical protein